MTEIGPKRKKKNDREIPRDESRRLRDPVTFKDPGGAFRDVWSSLFRWDRSNLLALPVAKPRRHSWVGFVLASRYYWNEVCRRHHISPARRDAATPSIWMFGLLLLSLN